MTKYFYKVWAADGDLQSGGVPDSADPNGYVSYDTGFTFDYQRQIGVDAAAKSIQRVTLNSVLNDITTNIQDQQQWGLPLWTAASANAGNAIYHSGSLVRYGNPAATWLSTADTNTTTPGAANATWINVSAGWGFVPVQQGGGAGQGNNKIRLGFDSTAGALRLQVDATDLGEIAQQTWVINVTHTWGAEQTFANGALVPTLPIATATVDAASTAFVQQALGARGHIVGFPVGSSNWLVPQNVTVIKLRIWGAGAGGGGCQAGYGAAGGGGGGGYMELYAPVTPGQSIPITVGTGGGGASGNSTNNGADGGFTVFNNQYEAGGGKGGMGAAAGQIGNGGVGGTNINNPGTPALSFINGNATAGQQLAVNNGSLLYLGGSGGPCGFNSTGSLGGGAQGGLSYGFGTGGSGGANGGGGGQGANGGCVIEY